MSDLSVNQKIKQPEVKQEPSVETGGVIANNSSAPSPLFAPAAAETGGTIASNSSSSGGSISYNC